MEFDVASLLVSFVISGVGFVLFSYGRKMERGPHLGVGLVLMVFPYFIDGVAAMLAVAAALGVGLYLALRAGW
jgi:hypothetical protein